ncbi:glycosyltransferase family 2 protein [Fodinisporobacter ferrooxydans]|uniref:Glycosyltransferase family 2 protein n=1 Tax=Fodinisporobacter ferrooxydans TaxID=2901836 RepID=A0ABY4CEM9_9BACL|nr:glycosyltransferase family 2 protein [Alicyclobacillaceae bacterium MYW30-H2]
MTVTACLIVRDEAELLEVCIRSIHGFTKDVVVVDTGSLDDSPDIAKRLGCTVFHLPWQDDFSAARNFAIEHATGEWVLCIDADERIELACSRDDVHRMLETTTCQAFTAEVHSYLGQRRNSDFVFQDQRVVLFRRDPLVRFRRRVHEDVTESLSLRYGESLAIGKLPLVVCHLGYLDTIVEKRQKRERNIRLLQMEIAEHGSSPWIEYCLGTERAGNEQWDQALPLLEHVVYSGTGEERFWLPAAYALACCYLKLERGEDCSTICSMAIVHDHDMHFHFSLLQSEARFANKNSLAALLDGEVCHSLQSEQDVFAFSARYLVLFRQLWQKSGST